jgi:hypothetical protein
VCGIEVDRPEELENLCLFPALDVFLQRLGDGGLLRTMAADLLRFSNSRSSIVTLLGIV